MAPTIRHNHKDKTITVTYHHWAEAWQTGDVIRSAGIGLRGQIRDRGFYDDGILLQQLAEKMRGADV